MTQKALIITTISILSLFLASIGYAQPKEKDTGRSGVRDTLPPVISVKDTLPPVITLKDKGLVKAFKAAAGEIKSKLGAKAARTMSDVKTTQALVKTVDRLMLRCPQCSALKRLKKRLKK
jgi:hypothetical protein